MWFDSGFILIIDTPGTHYNMLHYTMVLDITLIIVGCQIVMLDFFFFFCYMSIHFTHVITWIANKELVLDPNNSVIKRLWCMSVELVVSYSKIVMLKSSSTPSFNHRLLFSLVCFVA